MRSARNGSRWGMCALSLISWEVVRGRRGEQALHISDGPNSLQVSKEIVSRHNIVVYNEARSTNSLHQGPLRSAQRLAVLAGAASTSRTRWKNCQNLPVPCTRRSHHFQIANAMASRPSLHSHRGHRICTQYSHCGHIRWARGLRGCIGATKELSEAT